MEDQEEWKSSDTHVELKGEREHDPFTSLMFGTRRDHRNLHDHQEQTQTQSPSTIDYEALMMNIDILMESVRGLKPLLQKFQPYLKQVLKKK
ncbi:hypothetical protein [Neobacillus jeddahensis]|uniref:hypothetical protein n=1 Tax=Neobacillus jeddahensis TaxID=1461580 RepID=UPI00058E9D87|nr:hypothetical protein [Neobacillus jeddahensis]